MPTDTVRLKVETLISILTENTRQKSVTWNPTADEYAFRLETAAANVRIKREEWLEPSEERSGVIRTLSIFNDKGRLIEEYSPSFPLEEKLFDKLFELARSSAYRTDEVLDKLINEFSAATSIDRRPTP